MKAIVGLGILASIAAAAIGYAATSTHPTIAPSPLKSSAKPEPASLAFRELIASDHGAVRLSEKARALANQRVRMVGFIAKLELAPRDSFYLTAQPVHGDESGAGTADLPVDAVLVQSSVGDIRAIESFEGLIEVTGTLELARGEDSAGRTHFIRLQLDSESSR